MLEVSDGVARIYGLRNAEANELLEFENEVFLSETFETKIVVYGEDHRRFRFYERALTRYGYEKKLTDDGWAMVKRVHRSNYDTEVS